MRIVECKKNNCFKTADNFRFHIISNNLAHNSINKTAKHRIISDNATYFLFVLSALVQLKIYETLLRNNSCKKLSECESNNARKIMITISSSLKASE